MARIKKSDIMLRDCDGAKRPVVNVKIRALREDFMRECATVAAHAGDTSGRFNQEWIDQHVSESTGNVFYDSILRRAWETATDEAGSIWPGARVYGYGRSEGWASVDAFTEDDVLGWDARSVQKWATFAGRMADIVADVPYQYIDSIYHNVFVPAMEAERNPSLTITIELKTANAAFQPEASAEVYRILRRLTDRVSEGGLHFLPGTVQDSNGNTVGTVTVTGR